MVYQRFHTKGPFGHFGRGLGHEVFLVPKDGLQSALIVPQRRGSGNPRANTALVQGSCRPFWTICWLKPIIFPPAWCPPGFQSFIAVNRCGIAHQNSLNYGCCTTRDKVRFSGTCPNIKKNGLIPGVDGQRGPSHSDDFDKPSDVELLEEDAGEEGDASQMDAVRLLQTRTQSWKRSTPEICIS